MATILRPSENFLDVDLKPKSSALSPGEADKERRYAPKYHTHSSVQEDLGHVRAWLREGSAELLEIREVSLEDCKSLAEQLAAQGIKPRYNWYSDKRTAVFKMTTHVHDAVGEWMALQAPWLNKALGLAHRCGVPKLESCGSAATKFPDGGRRQPDKGLVLALTFEGPPGPPSTLSNPVPRLILETAYSQPEASARETIADQLQGSEGQTHVAILCRLKYPVTSQRDAWATVEIWVPHVGEDDIDALFPHEETDFEHEIRQVDQPTRRGDVGDTLAAVEDHGSVDSNESTTVGGTEADRTLVEPEVYLHVKSGFEMRRRWGPVVVLNEHPEGPDSPGPACGPDAVLPLRVFDFLRVCSLHDREEHWPARDELELPLHSLRSAIESALARMRHKDKQDKPKVSAAPPKAPKRSNPALSGPGPKRQRKED
ncbi:hypothetical protein FRC12_004653 [Ceratobasidium sp. 428]|nr:hypothetical protein FRC12_004653 [Ceratobasidium sp. 428]